MKEKILSKKKELEAARQQLQAQINYVIGQLALCDELLTEGKEETKEN